MSVIAIQNPMPLLLTCGLIAWPRLVLNSQAQAVPISASGGLAVSAHRSPNVKASEIFSPVKSI